MAVALFISRTDLVRNSILDGNVDTDKFIQFIKLGQEIDIQNLLGTDLYNRISDDITNDTLIIFHLQPIRLRMGGCLNIQAKQPRTLIRMKLII